MTKESKKTEIVELKLTEREDPEKILAISQKEISSKEMRQFVKDFKEENKDKIDKLIKEGRYPIMTATIIKEKEEGN